MKLAELQMQEMSSLYDVWSMWIILYAMFTVTRSQPIWDLVMLGDVGKIYEMSISYNIIKINEEIAFIRMMLSRVPHIWRIHIRPDQKQSTFVAALGDFL